MDRASPVCPELVYVSSDDGWQLALHHYRPAQITRRHPVLMVHGIAANHFHFDLDDHYSLARAAMLRGFDTWVLELRGAGVSRPPQGPGARGLGYGFADFAERDVPTAIAEVLEKTGAQRLHGVGHSMGGMLLFCVATQAHAEMCSITSIGTPLIGQLNLDLGTKERRLLQLASHLSPAASFTPPSRRRVPLRRLLGAAGLVMPLSSRLADNFLLNIANCEPYVLLRLAKEGIHDIPVQLVTEITQQLRGPRQHSSPYAYEDRLSMVVAPILAICGSADRIAPPASVSSAVARLTGPDVRYREMGTSFGDRADYGHVDLLLGRHAPQEVYPQVLDFLEETDLP